MPLLADLLHWLPSRLDPISDESHSGDSEKTVEINLTRNIITIVIIKDTMPNRVQFNSLEFVRVSDQWNGILHPELIAYPQYRCVLKKTNFLI